MKLKDMTILYVEDEKTILKINTKLLKTQFKEVYSASNGAEGLEKYNQYKNEIDLIISDISMPILNGLEMIEKIKQYNTSNIKFILTTSYTDTDYLLKAIEFGVFAYIQKPINISELFDKVSTEFEKDTKDKIVNLYDDFQYNYNDKKIIKDNDTIELTSDELFLLELLITNKDEILDYKILRSVNRKKPISMDSLRSTIKRIRQKTTNDLILTLSGVGYKINV